MAIQEPQSNGAEYVVEQDGTTSIYLNGADTDSEPDLLLDPSAVTSMASKAIERSTISSIASFPHDEDCAIGQEAERDDFDEIERTDASESQCQTLLECPDCGVQANAVYEFVGYRLQANADD